MTPTTLEKTIALLEREIPSVSDAEKADAAQRLRRILAPAITTFSRITEDEDDMFNNMPV